MEFGRPLVERRREWCGCITQCVCQKTWCLKNALRSSKRKFINIHLTFDKDSEFTIRARVAGQCCLMPVHYLGKVNPFVAGCVATLAAALRVHQKYPIPQLTNISSILWPTHHSLLWMDRIPSLGSVPKEVEVTFQHSACLRITPRPWISPVPK
jgi:hypothetical protein